MKEERIRLSHKSPRKRGERSWAPRGSLASHSSFCTWPRGVSNTQEEPSVCFCLLRGADLLPLLVPAAPSFRGDAASTRMIFSPLNAFYGELFCQHMGSACFYSFQTVLLSSAASFILKLLESSREMKAGAGVLARRCLAERAVFSLLFTEEPRQENDSPLSIMNLASISSLLVPPAALRWREWQ